MGEFYRSVVIKCELSNTANLSVFISMFVPILTYGHELWVMTEKILSRAQAAEISLERVHGVTLHDKAHHLRTRWCDQRSSKDQTEWFHLRSCLVPSWRGTSRTFCDRCWLWGISISLRAAAFASLAREKAGTKMIEKGINVSAPDYTMPVFTKNYFVVFRTFVFLLFWFCLKNTGHHALSSQFSWDLFII